MLFFSINCFSQKGKWKNVLRKNTISEYKEFIEKYPESGYLDSAKFKIIELEFEKAKKNNTIESYREFIANYPESKFIDLAKIKLEILSPKPLSQSDLDKYIIFASQQGNYLGVKDIISRKANINFQENGWTALMWACYEGYLEIVKLLIANGADIYLKHSGGKTAFVIARERGYVDIVNVIASHVANINLNDINLKDNDGNTALMNASRLGAYELVYELIAKGADTNLKNKNGKTALIIASRNDYFEIVAVLAGRGAADMNIKDNDGKTALMYASENGSSSSAGQLIIEGADINLKDNDGNTSLMLASREGHTDIVNKFKLKALSDMEDALPPKEWNDYLFGQVLSYPYLLKWSQTGQKPLDSFELNLLIQRTSTKMGGRVFTQQGYLEGGGSVIGWIKEDSNYSSVFFTKKRTYIEGIGELMPTNVSLTPARSDTKDTYKFRIDEASTLLSINLNLIIPCYSILKLDTRNSPISFCGYIIETGIIKVSSEGLILQPGTKVLRKDSN